MCALPPVGAVIPVSMLNSVVFPSFFRYLLLAKSQNSRRMSSEGKKTLEMSATTTLKEVIDQHFR
jgi:hypothetical protein